MESTIGLLIPPLDFREGARLFEGKREIWKIREEIRVVYLFVCPRKGACLVDVGVYLEVVMEKVFGAAQ